MSQLQTTTTAKARKETKKQKSVQTEAIYQALDSMEIHVLPLAKLSKSELNVRKRPVDEKSLIELADSIKAVGILQNLVVYSMGNEIYGVAAGQRRFLALQQLVKQGHIASNFPVPVKIVTETDALIISLTENSQREVMHPADQIHAFIDLDKTGKTAVEIAGLLGYSTRHVNKCLRLSNMAPELLAQLDTDEITLDQLQALSGTTDHERQVLVWDSAVGYRKEPKYLREAIEQEKTPVENNKLVRFIGLDEYKSAGGTVETDLFTDNGFIENPPLLEKLTSEKLKQVGDIIAEIEGWQWSEFRLNIPNFYSDTQEKLELTNPKSNTLPDDYASYLKEIEDKEREVTELANNEDDPDMRSMYWDSSSNLEELARGIKNQGEILKWSDEEKSNRGIVVYLSYEGEISIHRGLIAKDRKLISNKPTDNNDENNGSTSHIETSTESQDLYSAALVKSLSSERSLAVQSALMQHPNVALAILVHDFCLTIFGKQYSKTIMSIDIHNVQDDLLKNAPTAQESKALTFINEQYEMWFARLPENWKNGFTWLCEWEQFDLIALLAFCTSHSISDINYNSMVTTVVLCESLRPVEAVIQFDYKEWWKPTKANFFGRISKNQIRQCLNSDGFTGKGFDVSGMKKGDAAQLAEDMLMPGHWLPECLRNVDSTNNNENAE